MMTPGPDADPNSVQALCRQMVQEAGAAAEAAERKAEDLKEKYQQAMTRFDKEVTKSSALKSEAEKLRRALQKECGLGDDAPLQRLLDEASDWRGRAQEISLLKGRVKELRNKLAAAAVETGSVMSDVTEGSTSAFSSHETAVRKNLERLEKDRRGNIAMAEVRVLLVAAAAAWFGVELLLRAHARSERSEDAAACSVWSVRAVTPQMEGTCAGGGGRSEGRGGGDEEEAGGGARTQDGGGERVPQVPASHRTRATLR
jgi:hypothetical protein